MYTEKQILDACGEGLDIGDESTGSLIVVRREDWLRVVAMLIRNISDLDACKASRGMAGEKVK